MKKITVYNMFLAFAIILNIGTGRSIYASIILICAGVLELVSAVPKIVRLFKHDSK